MKLFHLFLVIPLFLIAVDQPDVYQKIENIYSPTIADYRMIQDYLAHGARPYLERLKLYSRVARNFKIIGDQPDELPQSGIVPVNCSIEKKENCVVLYASLNLNYPAGLKKLVKEIAASDFEGHVIYHLGGWPNIEGGSLVLAHVPYAFKVAAFKEAQRLGYKRAFWLDTAIKPLVSLNTIFSMIEASGYFIIGGNYLIGSSLEPDVAKAFGITQAEALKIPNCFSGMIGLDFTNKTGVEIIDRWYQAAFHPTAFYSAKPEQFPYSIIVYQLGLIELIISHQRVAFDVSQINPSSLFLIDMKYWGFIHQSK